MPALLSTALLLFGRLSFVAPAETPPSVPEGAPGPAEPTEPGPAEPIEPPVEGPTPLEPAPSPPAEPPPPTLTPIELADPEGTTPPEQAAGPEVPPEPIPPDGFDYEGRSFEDMPYAPTAARRSADRRNNDVLVRPFRKPIYSIAAAARFATSLIGGREVIQPFGFGVAAQLRIHFLRVLKSRFGVEVYAGYTRFPQRVDYPTVEGGASITRLNLLAHTDVSAGPSIQIPIGPVFLQFGGSAGVAFSTLTRTQSIDAVDDQLLVSTDFLLRGGLSLGFPILNRHGLTLGAAVQHVFSRDEVAVDLAEPDGPTAQPFGTWLEINLGYQMWF